MNSADIEKYVLTQGYVTIPEVQHKFSLPYSAVRQVFKTLEDNGKIRLIDGLTYEWSANTPAQKTSGSGVGTQEKAKSTSNLSASKYEEIRKTILERRRQELKERLDNIQSEDDEEEVDDGSDDVVDDEENDDKEKQWRKLRQGAWDRWIEELANAKKEDNKVTIDTDEQDVLKFVAMNEEVDYGYRMDVAKKISHTLHIFNIILKLRVIQLGAKVTRYVFDMMSFKVPLEEVKQYSLDIKACIRASNDVKVIAPFGDNQVAIEVEEECPLDQYCKKALSFWLKNQNGRASIISLQRNLGIDFNRSRGIVDSLQKLNCVDRLNPDDSPLKPIFVKITQMDVETLFPKSLGWED